MRIVKVKTRDIKYWSHICSNKTKQNRDQILNHSPDFSRDGTPRLGEQGITSRTPKQRTLPNRTATIIAHHPPRRKLPPRPTNNASRFLAGKGTALHPPHLRALAPPEQTPGSKKWRENADPVASWCGRMQETITGDGDAFAAMKRHERARDGQPRALGCWGERCMWRRRYTQTRGGENEGDATMITRRERGRFGLGWWSEEEQFSKIV